MTMHLGVIFPQVEIGPDPGAVREYAQAAEGLGYTHLAAYDHVLGADMANRKDWRPAYTKDDLFHEPMALFGFLSAITTRIELFTEVLILPQRQTALVAKQAAEIDVLSGGRLKLGVGLGWNYVEYEALGEDFHNRGRRVEEQVAVLRALWTQEVVDFHGRWHTIAEAGINPLPVQRPIPVWFGGGRDDRAMRRIARLADGWFPQTQPGTEKETLDRFRSYLAEAGRPLDAVAVEARISIGRGSAGDWVKEAKVWEDLGATHLAVNTMRAGFTSVQQHIDAIRQFKEAMGS